MKWRNAGRSDSPDEVDADDRSVEVVHRSGSSTEGRSLHQPNRHLEVAKNRLSPSSTSFERTS